jgi:hypothetical protein
MNQTAATKLHLPTLPQWQLYFNISKHEALSSNPSAAKKKKKFDMSFKRDKPY